MKKQLLIVIVLFLSSLGFAQKAELKMASKAISKNNFTEALTALSKVESLKDNLDEKNMAKYLFLKVKALNGSGKIVEAANAINILTTYENKINKVKYSKEAKPILANLVKKLSDKGIKEYQNKNYKSAKVTLEEVYKLSKKDTTFLEYAANAAYLDKDYDLALEKFNSLKSMGYTDIKTIYSAINKATGNEDIFKSAKEMNNGVKMGIYETPKTEVTKSKIPSIIKNIAFIYVEKGDNEKAIEAIRAAREANPKDVNLIITEANIQIKMGNKDEFGKLMEEAIALKPNDATLYYNVGVISQEQGKIEEAKKYYKKSIELDPNNGNTYLNLGLAMLSKDKELVDEMNANMNDFDKYDEIKAKQLDLYREVLPTFEKANSLIKNDKGIMRTLMNLYENLEMYDKQKAIKAAFDALPE